MEVHLSLQTALVVLGLLVCWAITTVIYRFYFHPLAHIPGPPLAIATYFYEWYFDLVKGGQFTFQLRRLHKRYGSIIRINPDEVHIIDPDYFDAVFNVTNGKAHKPFKIANAFGPYPAAIGTVDHDLHRLRRGAVNPFFSRRSVGELVPFIQAIIRRLCERLDSACDSSQIVNMKYFYAATTLDIMNEYCFSKDPHTLLKPDFGKKGFDDVDSFLEISLLNIHIPWLMRATYSLPDWAVKMISPAMKDILVFREALSKQVEAIRHGQDTSHESSDHKTIFHELLDSKLPSAEMGRDRLRDEAFSLLTAGSGTSAYVLRNTSYHIAVNHEIQQRLWKELCTVMPDQNDDVSLQTLERLPYLTAIIQEGLRISQPVTHRNSRSFPNKTMKYKEKVIPSGTTIHMTALLTHNDPAIFPHPERFDPDRWLEDSDHNLQKYLIAFSRGPRSCLGINLAWAELYLVLAYVFRKFDFDVSSVDRKRDIDVSRDVIMGVPSTESKGVLVKVKKV